MSGIAVLVNPQSHRFRARDLAALRVRFPKVEMAVLVDLTSLRQELARLGQERREVLVLAGGDCMLREVLTALPACWSSAPPRLALVRAGNTNLAAWALGGSAALTRVLRAAERGRLRAVECPILEVRWNGQPERPALRGMLFGAAGFAEAKRMADEQVHRRGLYLRHAVGLAVGLALVRGLGGAGVLRRGVPMAVGIDAAAVVAGRRSLFLATTLPRLVLGLWPFWGGGAGGLRWLDIGAPPRLLPAAFLAVLLRRAGGWMERAGYRSGRAAVVALPECGRFVLDGEFFDAGPEGISLHCGGSVSFVRP